MIKRRINIGNMNKEYNKVKLLIESFYKENFILLIDTKNTTNVSYFHIYDFSIFLLELKKRKVQYLKKTIIYVYTKYIYNLLYYLFTLVRPIAPVVVYLYNEDTISIIKTFYP